MSEALWEWEALVAASNGHGDGTPDTAITGFSIDTRSLQPGEVFVALKDQRDGHAFVGGAFEAGASAALVDDGYVRQPGDGALLRVADTLKGLEGIAAAARARLSAEARVLAITGSAGKTGTKEMLRVALEAVAPGCVHASIKSFNNHWGVPLMLATMPADTRYGVFEIGMNHAGEITPLTRLVRPHVAIVTNVLPVHIGNFPDGETGIAHAKAEIFQGLGPRDVAIINADNAHAALLRQQAQAAEARIVTFAREAAADVREVRLELAHDGSAIEAEVHGKRYCYRLGLPGSHLAMNALAVLAALDAAGADLDVALPALADLSPTPGRGARTVLDLDGGTALLIDESYNANPASMRAAMAAMATVPRSQYVRRIAVLGDMLELGIHAEELHVGLQEAIDAAGVDLVFACGPHMRGLHDSLPPERQGAWAAASDDLVAGVMAAIRPGDVVMVKGSLGSRMAPVVEAIKAQLGVKGKKST